MGNWISSNPLPEETISQIETESGFTSSQIIALWRRFQVIDVGKKGYLTRENFLNLPDLAINPVSCIELVLNCLKIWVHILSKSLTHSSMLGSQR